MGTKILEKGSDFVMESSISFNFVILNLNINHMSISPKTFNSSLLTIPYKCQ